MTIVSGGAINTIVPDLLVQILPPPLAAIAGVATNILGVVGTATWGPVGSPTPFSTGADLQRLFGPIQARKFDLGTIAATAIQQGANVFRGVRVTDGTDTAATGAVSTGSATLTAPGTGYTVNDQITLANGSVLRVSTVTSGAVATFSQVSGPTSTPTGAVAQASTSGAGTGATFTFTYATGLTITSLYSGSGANGDTVTLAAGSKAGTWKATVFRTGLQAEVFDNLGSGLTGAALWAAIAAAINTGSGSLRGPSGLVVATAGASTTSPTSSTITMVGGTDGVSGVTAASLVGQDGVTRTGMYALRSTGAAVFVLADCDSSVTWASQVAFALSEGTYAVMVGPAGEYVNPTLVAANKATAGIDSYAAKLLVGDYITWLDPTTQTPRLVSPQGFSAGMLVNLGPQQSSLNKPLYGVIGTQNSASNQVYSAAELGIFGAAGLDVITNPVPGGFYFGARFGRNTSSNTAIHQDNYPRLTNFLSQSINLGMGKVVGLLQTPDQRSEAANALGGLLDSLWTRGIIGNAQGTQPYLVILDDSNNPAAQVAQGVEVASVQVQYLSVIETFLVNFTGGQTVTLPSRAAA